jgi:hypothetical protein
MKKIVTFLLLLSAFTSHAQRTMFGSNNNYVAPVEVFDAPAIVTNGLQLNLDASISASYSGSGTTWRDLSGYNNHATLMNGPTYEAASGSIVTNGTNQYVSVPLFNNSITNVTMQTWVYINTNTRGVFIANGYTGGYSIGIGSNTGFDAVGSQATMLFSYIRWINNTGKTYPAGWHLVTMVLDENSTPSFYVDTTFQYSSTGTAPATPSGSLTLGAIPGDGGRYYAGKFASAYFYNRVLSANEITHNYNITKSRFGL